MRSCFQTKGMSIYDHGIDVRSWYVELRDFSLLNIPLKRQWRMPSWLNSPKIKQFFLSANDVVMELYQTFHDCGKPFCRTVDDQGRQHFPDHALHSKERWMRYSDDSFESRQIADLIGMDMDIHLLSASQIKEFSGHPQALALLITGLCEIHSNSQMFGGIDSPGFKMKYKKIDRFGTKIVELS